MMSDAWTDIVKNARQIWFFRSKKDEKTCIRPVGSFYEFKEYAVERDGVVRYATCENESTCPIIRKYGMYPTIKYAMNIINRSTNRIEVFKVSVTSFNEFKRFYENTGKSPGYIHGAYFNVWMETIKDGRKVTKVKYGGPHTLDENDMKVIKSQSLYDIRSIFAAPKMEEIEYKLFGIKKNTDECDVDKTAEEHQLLNFNKLFT